MERLAISGNQEREREREREREASTAAYEQWKHPGRRDLTVKNSQKKNKRETEREREREREASPVDV